MIQTSPLMHAHCVKLGLSTICDYKVSMSILSINIFGFFDLLIQVCQIDFKLGMITPNTVRSNVESAATR